MRKGFLLLELVIALVIIALACSFSCRILTNQDRLMVRHELQCLATQCHYLQQLARLLGTPQMLTFYPKDHTYSFLHQRQALAPSTRFGDLPGVLGPPSQPQYVIRNPITFKQNRLTFYPDGTSSSGTVYLVNRESNTLYAMSCGVAPFSYIRCYVYRNKKWQRI